MIGLGSKHYECLFIRIYFIRISFTLSRRFRHHDASKNPCIFASNAKKPSCFYPVPQAADCIARVVERANAPVVYLSTDAAESETGLLQSLVVVNGRTVPLVTRPSRNAAEKWDALLYRHGLQEDAQVRLTFFSSCAFVLAWVKGDLHPEFHPLPVYFY
jgi:hypothetical protein